ncbi:MAG: hypothetical protein JWQ43_1970 [Glaciihabitans sp.]|nr:hypothetical protein [Glaciihabitans sp.]
MSRGAEGIVQRALTGTAAGALATGLMSGVFLIGDKLAFPNTRPPKIIVDKLWPRLDDRMADHVALATHLVYGAAGGKVYALVTPPRMQNVGTGIVYGLGVWAASYEGWVCGFGILPPAHRDNRGRAITILLAHVVYGAVLGAVAKRTATRHSGNDERGSDQG